jgi:glutamate dehydrogenase/leucine dehydrogenase
MNVVDAAVGPYERVVWATDRATGLRAVIAIHSTALGPAVGGTRWLAYPDEATAVIDVLRLAEGMTLKAAAAGLDLGGGKAVIIGDPRATRTPALLEVYAQAIDALGGEYYTAEDVGTTTGDMDFLRARTPYVLGTSRERGGCGDPSPFTSAGVIAAMRAAWEVEVGEPTLAGARVLVQGIGKVGGGVARLVAAEGARVMVSDVSDDAVAAMCRQLDAEAVPPGDALVRECDVLCPCALGGILTPDTVPELRCRLVCGATNNQPSSDEVLPLLDERGIAYVPDFIANAGGLIAVADEIRGFDAERVGTRVAAIGECVHDLLEEARLEGETTLAAAHRRADRRLAAARLPRAA